MKEDLISPSNLRLAGICGILAGLFVVAFAGIADSHKILFMPEIYSGGSSLPWIHNVLSSPALSRIAMILPLLGFSCFLVVGLIFYPFICQYSWQKNLGLAGYLIGVPFTSVLWISQLSLMNFVLLYFGKSPEMDLQIQAIATYVFFFFQISNDVFGPLFIIVIGTGMMAWAALKAGALPKWMCYWPMICGVLMLISFLSFLNPVLGILGFAAPAHMIWFIVLGVYLLRRSKTYTAE